MQQFIIHSCIAFSLSARVLLLLELLSTSKCTGVPPFPYGAFLRECQLFPGTDTVALAHPFQYMPTVSSLSHLPRGPCRSSCISGDTGALSFQRMGHLSTSHPSWWHSRAAGERGARTQREFNEEAEREDSETSVGDESESIWGRVS